VLFRSYSECGIKAEDEVWEERGRYLKDGLHPDVEGQQLMGQYIAKKIQDYLTVVLCSKSLL